MFNDEIYNNGDRSYFDFGEMAGFKIVPYMATHVKKSSKYQSMQSFGKPRVMGAIESLGCNWWKNMHQIDA